MGADAASKKALGRPVITFRAKVYSGGWGQSRFIIPEGYSTLEIVSLSGNGNVYGYTGDETTDPNGTVLGLLSVTAYDISGYKEFGVRVNGNSGAQCVLY